MYHIYIHFGKKSAYFFKTNIKWSPRLTFGTDCWDWDVHFTEASYVHKLVTVSSSLSLLWCKLHCDMGWAVCKIIWFCWIWLVRCWLTNKYTICVLTRLPPGSQITLQSHNAFTLFFQQKSSFARGASLQSWSGDLVGEEAAPAALARPAPAPAPAPRLGLQVAVGHGGEKQQPVPGPGL